MSYGGGLFVFLPRGLWGRCHQYLQFLDQDTETQKGDVMCLRAHETQPDRGQGPGLSGPKPCVFSIPHPNYSRFADSRSQPLIIREAG